MSSDLISTPPTPHSASDSPYPAATAADSTSAACHTEALMQPVTAIEMAELEASHPDRHRLVRWAFFSLGALLVGIGVAGIFLPLLPTTVFFLGAAACFGKSSPGAYRWLTTNRLFGRYLREYKEERGATVGTKMWSIGSLWLGLGVTGWFFQETWWVEGILAAVGIGVTWHLVALRTIRR